MSSYIKKAIKCQCCDKPYFTELLKGYLTCADIGLDTNPYVPAIYDRVVICPNCGYATSKPYIAITDDMKSVVKSDAYIKLLNDKKFDTNAKKLLLAGYLATKERDAKEAGYNYLLAYWYLKEINLPNASKACEKAIKNFEYYLNYNQDEEIAMIIIDCYRQMKYFKEAMETANSLEPHIANNKELMSILKFEKKLICNCDCNEHRVSEAEL